MAFPKSLPVSGGGDALASQYNNLRDDALYPVLQSFTYGETIAVNDALFLSSGAERIGEGLISHMGTSTTRHTSTNTHFLSQSFIATGHTIRQLTLRLRREGADNALTASIRAADVSGRPTGSDLASVSISGIPTTATNITLPSFPPFLRVTPGTTYTIVLRYETAFSNHIFWYFREPGTYADGIVSTSNDSGATWTTHSAQDFFFQINMAGVLPTIAERVYRTSAVSSEGNIHNFIGFAKEVGVDGNVRRVQIGGKVSGFTGLVVGVDYFLSDTAGAISTTPGTNRIVIGIAISATELLLLPMVRKKYVDDRLTIFLTPSDTLRHSADSERTTSGAEDVWAFAGKAIRITHAGRVRVRFDFRSAGVWGVDSRIYFNSRPLGTSHFASTSYVTVTEDLDVSSGTIEIWGFSSMGGLSIQVRNFRISYDLTPTLPILGAVLVG